MCKTRIFVKVLNITAPLQLLVFYRNLSCEFKIKKRPEEVLTETFEAEILMKTTSLWPLLK